MTEEHDEHEAHTEESAWDIATDPEHFVAELGYEAAFFILGALYLKWKLRKRDKAHHHTEIHNHFNNPDGNDLVKANLLR